MASSRLTKKTSPQIKKAEKLYQQACLILEGEIDSFNEDVEGLLRTAAALGHPEAMQRLGILLVEYAPNNKNYELAFKYFTKANAVGLLVAKCYLAAAYLEGAGCPENSERAMELFNEFIQAVRALQKQKKSTPELDQLLSRASATLAQQYYFLMKKSPIYENMAITLLSENERNGDKLSALNLALINLSKSRTETNIPRKMQLLEAWRDKLIFLADQHFSEAEFDLAVCYQNGIKIGTTQFIEIDLKRAEELYWRAAQGGKIQAFYHLSFLYFKQDNYASSFEILKTGALFGDKDCRKEYGIRVITDKKCAAENKTLAIRYLRELALTGDADVLYELGHYNLQCYRQSPSTLDQLTQAEADLRAAAAVPHYSAKYYLAELLLKFPGPVPLKSFREAEKNISEILARPPGTDTAFHALLKLAEIMRQTLETRINVLLQEQLVEQAVEKTRAKAKKSKPTKKIKKFPAIKRRPANTQNVIKTLLEESKAAESEEKLQPETVIVEPEDAKTIAFDASKSEKPANVHSDTAETNAAAESETRADKDAVLTIPELAPVKTKLPKPLPPEAIYCLDRLAKAGYAAYVTGGLVRNIFLGKNTRSDDIDIVTNAPVEVVEKIFQTSHNQHIPNLCRFKCGKRRCDINSDPQLDLLQTALRSDFTINTLFVDRMLEVTDPTGRALRDLEDFDNQLQTVVPTDVSFNYDPFRILRLLNFMSYGLTTKISYLTLTQYQQVLRRQYDSYFQLATVAERLAVSDAKITFLNKFDHYICKFFMSGNGNAVFHTLLANNFFEIFFPGVIIAPATSAWLTWRISHIDSVVQAAQTDNPIPKRTIYAILLAAILTELPHDTEEMQRLLKVYPFPNTLIWKLTREEVFIWAREKELFSLPQSGRDSMLAAITNEKIRDLDSHNFHFPGHPSANPFYAATASQNARFFSSLPQAGPVLAVPTPKLAMPLLF